MHWLSRKNYLINKKMSTARKILWNTISQLIGKGFVVVMGIIVIKMVTNYLGKTGYGEYTTAFEFLAFFGIVADLGLYTIGVREMAKDEKKVPMIIGNIMSIRLIIVLFMVVFAGVAAFSIPQYRESRIALAIIIAAISTVFNILTSTISSVLQVNLKMEYNSLASVAGKLVNLVYMIFVIYVLYPITFDPASVPFDQLSKLTESGFYQLIWAGVAGNVTMYLICHYYASKYTKIGLRFDKEFMKDVLIKALPYGIALVLNTVYFRIGSVLLSLIKGSTETGLYGVPMRILEAMGIVPIYFMNSVLPVLTRAIDKKDGSHKTIIQYAYDFLVIGSWPIVVGTIALAYPIIDLVASPEFLSNPTFGFYGSDAALQILIVALAFSFINSLFGFILVADNKQTSLLVRNAVGAVLTIILDLILIPILGVRGAAITNVITEAYVAVASYLIARHYIDFNIRFINTFKSAFSAVVMGAVVLALKGPTEVLMKGFGEFLNGLMHTQKFTNLHNANLLLLIPIGALVYCLMLYLTKTIDPAMIALIRKPKKATLVDEAMM